MKGSSWLNLEKFPRVDRIEVAIHTSGLGFLLDKRGIVISEVNQWIEHNRRN